MNTRSIRPPQAGEALKSKPPRTPSNQTYDGRLELTWTNKPLCLLAQEDGRYEWLPPADYRVAEVRLLKDAGMAGDVHSVKGRAKDNLLIRGDALNALTSLSEMPEFAREYLGKIKLVYIDPPFNTGEAFEQYEDNLEHSVWLTMMRDRLKQIQRLLAADGSVWVHLNDDEVHYAKVVMDELFTRANFVATFVWQKVDSPSENKKPIAVDHDYILCYSKNPGGTNFPRMPDPSVGLAFGSTDEKSQRRYRDRLLKKNGKESRRKDRWPMWFALPGPDGEPVYPIHDDGREARWSAGKEKVELWRAEDERIDDPAQRNIMWKERPGHFVRTRPEPKNKDEDDGKPRWRLESEGTHWVPYTREWAPDLPTRPWPTIWAASPVSIAQELAAEAMRDEDFADLDHDGAAVRALEEINGLKVLDDIKTTRQAKAHLRKLLPGVAPFETPKPEELMARIIEIATGEGDIVLDCFAGSGSTLTTAHKLERRWVGIEWERDTLETFTAPRLQKVVAGEDPWGITKHVGWEGGGGFRVLDVAESMFEADGGLVFLAERMTNGLLAEATAAQLGYEYEADPPFVGRKGQTRLAVIDGVVNESVVRLIVPALGNGERVVVCGTGIDTDARPILRELRPGSTLRKIPAALLNEYRSSRQLRLDPAAASPSADRDGADSGD
jgi:adenine-specific DNA-methyltransferase